MAEFSYEVKKEIGVLSKSGKWTKEINLVSYNGAEPKIDIRSWQTEEDGTKKMSKGITLTKEEALTLYRLLGTMSVEE